MASKSSNRILSVYNSRKTILELLEYRDYDVKEYKGFSINEIDAMFMNQQLDLLITHTSDGKKVFVKYFLSSKIRAKDLDEAIEDLYVIENVLTKADTLIVIVDEEPNDTMITKLRYLHDHDGIFVVMHNIERLQYNILDHVLNPDVTILDEAETENIRKKYKLKSVLQLPEIGRFDPLALALTLRPGQVCEMQRSSVTALFTKYYRICV